MLSFQAASPSKISVNQMSKVNSQRKVNLEAFFEKMRRQAINNPKIKLEEVQQSDLALEKTPKQENSKAYDQSLSNFYAFNKQNTCSLEKKSVGSSTKTKRKISILDYFQDKSVGQLAKQRSRSRDQVLKIKKSKKKTNSKKIDKTQPTLQKYYPNMTTKDIKPQIKKERRKQKQLTLQFFCRDRRSQKNGNKSPQN